MELHKALTFLTLATAFVFALAAWAQQKAVALGFSPAKPFTQEQVSNMVRATSPVSGVQNGGGERAGGVYSAVALDAKKQFWIRGYEHDH